MKKSPILSLCRRVPALRRARKLSPCRILVVEPNCDLRLLYTDALAGPCCQVDVAEGGAEAWAALQARPYHLLFTENDPPNFTGDELIFKLSTARVALPVVMTSGRLATHEPVRDPSYPFAATLRQPFDLEALLKTVTGVLGTFAHAGKNPPITNHLRNPQGPTPICASTHYEISSQEQAINFR